MIDFNKDVKISYACPSYRRPKCLTAQYIPETKIYIDESDEKDYREKNVGYGEIVVCEKGIQGNLPRVRNYILDKEFENGADIVVMMDDDVESIGLYKPNKENHYGYRVHKLVEMDEIDWFIKYGSLICQEWGYGMWGINYNSDPMLYQLYKPFTTLRPAIGQFMVFVKNELRFDENLPLKEDYDMCIQQINKYRGMLGIMFAYVNADFGKNIGGTSVRRNYESEKEQFKLFKRKWGSDIVRGCPTQGGLGKGNNKKNFKNKYDFSHPRVNIPIKGI